jgi:hypothetical protein
MHKIIAECTLACSRICVMTGNSLKTDLEVLLRTFYGLSPIFPTKQLEA